MADNRITKSRLRNHWLYGWWKYLIVVIVGVFGVDMVFAMTRYRPPENKKVEVYMCNGYMDATAVEETIWPVFVGAYPEQEELTVMNINLLSDDMYVDMQFTTYIGAGQGDLLVLPKEETGRLIGEDPVEEAFADLTPYIESGVIDVTGIDLSAGMFKRSDGTQGVFAIPADSLGGLWLHGENPPGGLMCILTNCGNVDHAAAVLGLMVRQYHGPVPQAAGTGGETPQLQIFN